MNNKEDIKELLREIIYATAQVVKAIFAVLPHLIKRMFNSIDKRLRFSITFKMTAIYALVFSLILFFINALIVTGFSGFLYKISYDNMSKISRAAIQDLKGDKIYAGKMISQLAKTNNVVVSIFNKDKQSIFSTEQNKNFNIFYKDADEIVPQEVFTQHIMVISDKLIYNDEDAFIQITKKLTNEIEYINILVLIMFILDIGFISTTIGIGSKTSKKMLLPVQTMTSSVKQISADVLDTRIDVVKSHDELKELAETFNSMLDRMQDSFEKQHQFVSDASHELRTPISVIQGYANMLDRWGKDDTEVLQESISAIKSESESMKELIEKLLFLARSDKNVQKVEKIDFSMKELVDEVIKETNLYDFEHEITGEIDEDIIINADRKLLKEALRIFIDNSIKYTQKGGRIKLSVYPYKEEIEINVEDTGSGIPKEDIPHIFDRFYRSDKSRTKGTGGNGLGLAIAEWIIKKHNGRIQVESTLGVGTRMRIFLKIK